MATYFYDGQVRRYLLQIIRLMSNFVVKYGDGSLVRIPVSYGNADRQVANITNQNSEGAVQSAPRISVYITGLELDNSRIGDSSFVGKITVRERAINSAGEYVNAQGNNYTVERLMPTPFKLTVKVDIWSTSDGQKLEIIEQILMLFNPSLEIQTTDNYVDWTSLSVVDLQSFNYSSKTVPVGTSEEIDIATLTLSTPIWLSPPAKVKQLGIVTSIISGIFSNNLGPYGDYSSGLGVDPMATTSATANSVSSPLIETVTDCEIEVSEGKILILGKNGNYPTWESLLPKLNGQYRPGLSKIFLKRQDGTYVVGFFTLNPLDPNIMSVNWDTDTYAANTILNSNFRQSLGTFDAIIDPRKSGPGAGLPSPVIGIRYLILEDIGGGYKDEFITDTGISRINTGMPYNSVTNHRILVDGVEVDSGSLKITDTNSDGTYCITLDKLVPIGSKIYYEVFANSQGASAWRNLDNSDLIASENDIIEWDGVRWNVVFNAEQNRDKIVYLTNTFTNTQYSWNGVSWSKNFEGTYGKGGWGIEL